jgi:2-polyprenyl-3-methyl-5-hydroxy-6-metoxy-1,4-benzoquinol methylase
MSTKPHEWWHAFFPDFRAVFDQVSRKQTNAQVNYIISKMNLRPGHKFLDCPCGIGRIALPLARKGIRVTGVDITPSYLTELESKAKRSGLKINCVHCDMRRIDFKEEFDAAGNLWTSFGYFERESDNLLTLKKIFQALKPGGKFLLHLINRDWIMAHYASRDWFECKGTMVLLKNGFDYEKSISRGDWHIIRDGRETVHSTGIRMYSCHELIEMFSRVGFVDIRAFGTTTDEPVGLEQRMIFIFGARPKA